MKKFLFITIIFLFANSFNYGQSGLLIGIEGSHITALGSLSDRYNPGFGFSLTAGEKSKSAWNWAGRLEFIRLSEENEEKLSVRKRVTVGAVQKDFSIPLKSLVMDLKIYGASANLTYDFLDFGVVQGQVSVGFGIYRWENLRSAVTDSLFADTAGTGSKVFIEYLNVPENKQTDWSGGFCTGVKLNVPIIEPISLNISGHYKTVIGELWPALALDKDNVSVFQMFDIKIGLTAKL